jgi:hypothetical protein
VPAVGRVGPTHEPQRRVAPGTPDKGESANLARARIRTAGSDAAIYENGLASKIESGGRQLTYGYTVRRLLPAFVLKPPQGASAAKELKLISSLHGQWTI